MRVSQILINYVSNAVKFSERGDIWVRLGVETEERRLAAYVRFLQRHADEADMHAVSGRWQGEGEGGDTGAVIS